MSGSHLAVQIQYSTYGMVTIPHAAGAARAVGLNSAYKDTQEPQRQYP